MSPRAPANVPTPLSLARRQFDQWRSQQPGRKHLPRELWAQAVALAREHGINRTARTLGLKYDSLEKHIEAPRLWLRICERPGTENASIHKYR